jgi:hypothetical protein
VPAGGSIEDALVALAATWAENPWGSRVPAVLAEAALLPREEDPDVIAVVDPTGAALPLLADAVPWSALARTGGRPTLLVGEVERTGFRVLSVLADDLLVAV